MNPRQRRGAILVALALVTSAATFFAVFRYVQGINTQVGPRVQVMALTVDVPAWTPVTADMLGAVTVPVRWVSGTSLTFESTSQKDQLVEAVVGKVFSSQQVSGSFLQKGMLETAPALDPGQRRFALKVDAESGVDGQLKPDDTVDVIATFNADTSIPDDIARTVIVGARVLTVASGDDGDVVTLALDPTQVQDLAFAQSFAASVRLVQVPPGTDSVVPDDQRQRGTAQVTGVQGATTP